MSIAFNANEINNTKLFEVKDYGAIADGTTDATSSIQLAVDALNTNGGGVLLLESGTYLLSNAGVPADGSIKVSSNIIVQGQGIGNTILKLADTTNNSVTGVIRTTSAQEDSNVFIRDLTIDGNLSNQTTVSITGITQAAGTATATSPSSSLRPSVGDTITIDGANESGYTGTAIVVLTTPTSTTFTYAVDSGTASPATGTIIMLWNQDGFYCGVTPGSTDRDYNITLDHVEIKNMTRYGFDPHEVATHISHLNCIAHGCNKDGFVADYIEDGLWFNCESYNNGRHGFNVTGICKDLTFDTIRSYSNGDNGFVTARAGAGKEPYSMNISNSSIYSNTKEGMRIRTSYDVKIANNDIYLNGRDGINVSGSQEVIIEGNNFRNNGQTTNNTYDDIVIDEDSSSVASIDNYVSDTNIFVAEETNKVRYHIAEEDASTNNNVLKIGHSSGAVTGDILLSGSTSFAEPYTYTVTTVPTASSHTGKSIYVNNGAAGSAILAFSNGTNWLRSDTGAAIASS